MRIAPLCLCCLGGSLSIWLAFWSYLRCYLPAHTTATLLSSGLLDAAVQVPVPHQIQSLHSLQFTVKKGLKFFFSGIVIKCRRRGRRQSVDQSGTIKDLTVKLYDGSPCPLRSKPVSNLDLAAVIRSLPEFEIVGGYG